MKKTVSFILLFLFYLAYNAHSQYITPGNNLTLSLGELVDLSGGVVTFSNNEYHIHNTLTLSASDTLRIHQAAVVRVAQGIRLEIKGTIISDPPEGAVVFTAADTSSVTANFNGFRFENSPSNFFRHTEVSYGGGLQLISSGAVFESCSFRKNGSSNVSAVITYSSCDPIISGCSFIENARSAIGSGANVQGSPQILNNYFYRNTTDNSNRPQINLGPGAADTIFIVGNYIEGFYPMAGGIGISNLVGVGNTKVAVRQNTIVRNRYGYAQIGNTISSLIEDNELIDNNIQDIPAQGGSGLNFQATGSGNIAVVRKNLIKGNLWGVTIQGTAQPSFGTAVNVGRNLLFGNGNSEQIYDLYNNTALAIDAVGNYWGTNDPDQAENHIFHQPDQASLGLVTYLPLMEIHPIIESFVFRANENPGLPTDCVGLIDPTTHSIHLVVPSTANPNALIARIGLPAGVTTAPESGQAVNYSSPVLYSVQTPHGESAEYLVSVEVQTLTYSLAFEVSDPNGPLEGALVELEGQAAQTTGLSGICVFNELMPALYAYTISKPQYETKTGNVEIVDESLTLNISLDPLTGLAERQLRDFMLNPNPATTWVQIEGKSEQKIQIMLCTLDGKMLLSQEFAPNSLRRLDVSSLKAGVYQLIIKADKQINLRLIKQ